MPGSTRMTSETLHPLGERRTIAGTVYGTIIVLSVLSVGRGLTIWCRSGEVSLSTPGGASLRWNYADLVEAAEHTVWHSEELEFGGNVELGEDQNLLAQAQ